jgi:SPP1 family predicted phage head-tail adaptor
LNKQVDQWVNVLPDNGKLWASVVDLSGRQFVAAGGKQNEIQTQIKIRRRAGVIPSMRVLCGGFIYDIQAVLQRDQHFLYLMCSKGMSDG